MLLLEENTLVDKVTIGTCNLVSVIANFAVFLALDKIHSSIQFSSRLTLQLINGISNDLQKLLKYSNGTTIFASLTKICVLATACVVFLERAVLNLNDWELSTAKSTLPAGFSSLINSH